MKKKIIKADNSRFYPNRNVNRVEFLAMLINATGENLPIGVTKTWRDIKWSDWYYRYAVFAFQNNLIDGVDGQNFKPNTAMTRAEVAEGLYRYLRMKNKL